MRHDITTTTNEENEGNNLNELYVYCPVVCIFLRRNHADKLNLYGQHFSWEDACWWEAFILFPQFHHQNVAFPVFIFLVVCVSKTRVRWQKKTSSSSHFHPWSSFSSSSLVSITTTHLLHFFIFSLLSAAFLSHFFAFAFSRQGEILKWLMKMMTTKGNEKRRQVYSSCRYDKTMYALHMMMKPTMERMKGCCSWFEAIYTFTRLLSLFSCIVLVYKSISSTKTFSLASRIEGETSGGDQKKSGFSTKFYRLFNRKTNKRRTSRWKV